MSERRKSTWLECLLNTPITDEEKAQAVKDAAQRKKAMQDLGVAFDKVAKASDAAGGSLIKFFFFLIILAIITVVFAVVII